MSGQVSAKEGTIIASPSGASCKESQFRLSLRIDKIMEAHIPGSSSPKHRRKLHLSFCALAMAHCRFKGTDNVLYRPLQAALFPRRTGQP
jgi:hypothetical protein